MLRYYDISNTAQRLALADKVSAILTHEKGVVALDYESNVQRTLSQNSYLHLLIAYVAARIGVTPEYCKRHYFKLTANKELFPIKEHRDNYSGITYETLPSTANLTKEQMSEAIDRFRNWAADVKNGPGINTPDADDVRWLATCQNYIRTYKQFDY